MSDTLGSRMETGSTPLTMAQCVWCLTTTVSEVHISLLRCRILIIKPTLLIIQTVEQILMVM